MNHPPFGPADLQGAPLAGGQFIQQLHQQRAEKYPEPPPFFQTLFDGSVGREDLQTWVKNSYYYWDHGLQYSTGGILAKTANEEVTRIKIIKKLVNVEGKDVVRHLNGATTPGYSELWLRFGQGVGLRREEGDVLEAVHPVLFRRRGALYVFPMVGMDLAGWDREFLRG